LISVPAFNEDFPLIANYPGSGSPGVTGTEADGKLPAIASGGEILDSSEGIATDSLIVGGDFEPVARYGGGAAGKTLEMTGNMDALTGESAVGDYTTELTERQQAGEVFDAKYYAQMNPDLASAGLKTPEQLYEHFQEFGIEEGRSCSPLVDLKYYELSNPELAEAGLTTPQQL
jgi:hypothetical protein